MACGSGGSAVIGANVRGEQRRVMWPGARIPGFRIPARQASGFWIPAERRLRPPFFGSVWWLSGGAQRRSEENFAVQSLKRPRIPDPGPSADSAAGATSQRTQAHALKISRTINKLTSAFTSALNFQLGFTEFFRYGYHRRNVDRHPRASAIRAAKSATPAVEKARSMGRVDRHDVKASPPERRRALARAEVRLTARRAAHEATCAAPLSSHYSPRAARRIRDEPRAARSPDEILWGWMMSSGFPEHYRSSAYPARSAHAWR